MKADKFLGLRNDDDVYEVMMRTFLKKILEKILSSLN